MNSLEFKLSFAAPIDKVWDAWTTAFGNLKVYVETEKR